ncbi:hypothetical protein AALO_G00282440 [Alosa alosa]|uniref:THAP-type domain-containing protein n=1 Tax=Alosa alosa TaxID=278164 RepID=A0AAV6FPM3_9TELE|nr:hypothetical protein AALO_G00282440 [Alosa alosa]
MPVCFVPQCAHSSRNGCSFFRFPGNARTKTLWLKRIRNIGTPHPGLMYTGFFRLADREPNTNDRYCKVVVDPDQGLTEGVMESEDGVAQDSMMEVEMELDPDEIVAQNSKPVPSTYLPSSRPFE